MYSVTDADSEVILFGTFHILPEDIEWQNDALSAAIERSEEAWYELPVGSENDPAIQQLTMQYGMSQTPLSERLSTEQNAKLKSVMDGMGFPTDAVEPMQPWLAAISIPVFQMMKEGYSPEMGAEMQLQKLTGGKGQRAFETAEQQLRFFADMPEAKQIEYLEQVLDDADEGMALMDKMAEAWATGDVEFLENEIIGEMKRETPELYDVLIKTRNTAWAETLDTEMKGEGVDFVAVGAGHLVGPDSVPALLRAKGYTVTQLTE
jgi:uncharacterized protein YbaP (TraB family)